MTDQLAQIFGAGPPHRKANIVSYHWVGILKAQTGTQEIALGVQQLSSQFAAIGVGSSSLVIVAAAFEIARICGKRPAVTGVATVPDRICA